MNDIFIDFEKARNLLSEVVSEGGDAFVYKQTCRDWCTYWNTDEDKPDCGVGRVLHKAGVPGSVLRAMDIGDSVSLRNLQTDGVLGAEGIHLDWDALEYLAIFQTHQDRQDEWGEAQHKAELWARERGLVTE